MLFIFSGGINKIGLTIISDKKVRIEVFFISFTLSRFENKKIVIHKTMNTTTVLIFKKLEIAKKKIE